MLLICILIIRIIYIINNNDDSRYERINSNVIVNNVASEQTIVWYMYSEISIVRAAY